MRMDDAFAGFLDTFVLCAGLVAIMWVVLGSGHGRFPSWRVSATALGMLAWLAAFGLALYFAFG